MLLLLCCASVAAVLLPSNADVPALLTLALPKALPLGPCALFLDLRLPQSQPLCLWVGAECVPLKRLNDGQFWSELSDCRGLSQLHLSYVQVTGGQTFTNYFRVSVKRNNVLVAEWPQLERVPVLPPPLRLFHSVFPLILTPITTTTLSLSLPQFAGQRVLVMLGPGLSCSAQCSCAGEPAQVVTPGTLICSPTSDYLVLSGVAVKHSDNYQLRTCLLSDQSSVAAICYQPLSQLSSAPSSAYLAVSQSNYYRAGTMAVSLSIVPSRPVLPNSTLQLTLEGQWRYLQEFNCSNLKKLSAFTFAFTSRSKDRIVCEAVLGSPAQARHYGLTANFYSGQTLFETGQNQLLVNQTLGSTNRFRVSLVRPAKILKRGQTGALELLLTLNNRLPQTALSFFGKLVVTVQPQLVSPVGSGQLACFFEINNPCANVSLSNSVPGQTSFTFYTPANMSFKESQIPVTITTVGANPNGVRLNPSTMLYTVSLATYSSESPGLLDSFTQQFLLSPGSFPLTAFDYFPHYDLYSTLRLQSVLPQALSGVQAVLQLGEGWAIDLPSTVPCLVQGMLNAYPQCLRLGNSIIIKMQAESLAAGQPFQVLIPGLKHSGQNRGDSCWVELSLRQNQPGQVTNPIVYYLQRADLTPLTPDPSSQDSTLALVDLNQEVSAPAVLNLLFNGTAATFADVVLPLPADSNSAASCGANQCITLANSVYLLVFPATPFPNSASVSLSSQFSNPPYACAIDYVLRTSSGSLSLFSSVFTRTILPLLMSNLQFSKEMTLDTNPATVLLRGLYKFTFTSVSALSAEDQIVVQLQTSNFEFGTYASASPFSAAQAHYSLRPSSCTITLLSSLPSATTIQVIVEGHFLSGSTLQFQVYSLAKGVAGRFIDRAVSSPTTIAVTGPGALRIKSQENKKAEPRAAIYSSIQLTVQLFPSSLIADNLQVDLSAIHTPAPGLSLVCLFNSVRVPCSYQPGFRVGLASLSALLPSNKLAFSFELVPVQGILMPAPGLYPVSVKALSGTSVLQSSSSFLRVVGKRFAGFSAQAFLRTSGANSFYRFAFLLDSAGVPSYTAGGTIRIYFPGSINSNAGFGSLPTGSNVPCKVTGLAVVSCRWVDQPSSYIELVGFTALAANLAFTVDIISILNPAHPHTSITFRTQAASLTAGLWTSIYSDFFQLYLPLASASPSPQTYPLTVTVVGALGSPGTIALVPDLQPGDCYVIQLPSSVSVTGVFPICNSTQLLICYSFPQTNQVVLLATLAPVSTLQFQVNFPAYVLQSDPPMTLSKFHLGLLTNVYSYSLLPALSSMQGLITTFTAVPNTDSRQFIAGKDEAGIIVSFAVAHAVPAGGSLSITFPNHLLPYSHCRSMVQSTSLLFGAPSGKTGQVLSEGGVACQKQQQAWVVSATSALAAGATVKLYGVLKVLGAGSGQARVQSFGPSRSPIDDGNFSMASVTASSVPGFSLKSDEMNWVESQFVAGARTRLRLYIKFSQDLAVGSAVELRLASREVRGGLTGFILQAVAYACFIDRVTASIGCSVSKSVDSTTNNEAVIFSLAASSVLVAGKTYQFELSTMKFDLNEGILLPSASGQYLSAISVLYPDGSYEQATRLFRVLPSGKDWLQCDFKSLSTYPGEFNVLLLVLQPSTLMLADDQILIQFQSADELGNILILPDLGTGLAEHDPIPFDIYAGPVSTMTCRLYHGDHSIAKPVLVSCSGLNTLLGPATTAMQFALQIINLAPAATTRMANSIVKVSLRRGGSILNQRIVEAGVVVYPQQTSVSAAGTFTLALQTKQRLSSISFTLRNQLALAAGDICLLKLGFTLGLPSSTLIASDFQHGTGFIFLGNAIYLNKFNILVGFLTGTVAPLSLAATTLNAKFATGVFNPYFNPTAAQSQVAGYICYRSALRTTKVVFTDSYPLPTTFMAGSSSLSLVREMNIQACGSYDDYIFTFVMNAGDLSFPLTRLKKVVLAMTGVSAGLQFTTPHCQNGAGSNIIVTQCTIDSPAKLLTAYVSANGLFAGATLVVRTTGRSVYSGNAAHSFNLNLFTVYYYSWEGSTQPSPSLANNLLAQSSVFASSFFSYYINSAISVDASYDDELVIDGFEPQSLGPNQIAPIRFLLSVGFTFTAASGSSYNTLTVTFNGLVAPPASASRLLCYLGDNACPCEMAGSTVTARFKFGLSPGNLIVEMGFMNPTDSSEYGFASTQGIVSCYVVVSNGTNSFTYELPGLHTVYRMPPGTLSTAYPHRGITGVSVNNVLTTISGQTNAVSLALTLTRTDYRGVLVELDLVSQTGSNIYSSTSMLGLSSGSDYPCSVFGDSASCLYVEGSLGTKGKPAMIFVTGFTPTLSPSIELLIQNPTSNGVFVQGRVRLLGGTTSAACPVGCDLMGHFELPYMFKTASGTIDSASYTASFNKGNWQPQTSLSVSLPYSLSTSNFFLAKVQLVSGGAMNCAYSAAAGFVYYAYWVGNNQYLYVRGSGQGSFSLTISYLKCKKYSSSFISLTQMVSQTYINWNTITVSSASATTVATGLSTAFTVSSVEPASRNPSASSLISISLQLANLNAFMTADNADNYMLSVLFPANFYMTSIGPVDAGGEALLLGGVVGTQVTSGYYSTGPPELLIRSITKFSATKPLIILLKGTLFTNNYPSSMTFTLQLFADQSAYLGRSYGYPVYYSTASYNTFPTLWDNGFSVSIFTNNYGTSTQVTVKSITSTSIQFDVVPGSTVAMPFNALHRLVVNSLSLSGSCILLSLRDVTAGADLAASYSSCTVSTNSIELRQLSNMAVTVIGSNWNAGRRLRFSFSVLVSSPTNVVALKPVYQMVSLYSYSSLFAGDCGATFTLFTYKNDLADSASLSLLSYTTNTVTELTITLIGLNFPIGPADSSLIFITIPGGSHAFTSSTQRVQLIPCICNDAPGTCLRYLPLIINGFQFALAVNMTFAVGDSVTCSFPGLTTPSASFTPAVLKNNFGPMMKSYAQNIVNTLPLVTLSPPSTAVLAFTQTGNPYAAASTTGQAAPFYQVTLSFASTNNPAIFAVLGTASPLPTCPPSATFCRIYSKGPCFFAIGFSGTFTSLTLSFGTNPETVSIHPWANSITYQLSSAGTLISLHSFSRTTNLLNAPDPGFTVAISPKFSSLSGVNSLVTIYLPSPQLPPLIPSNNRYPTILILFPGTMPFASCWAGDSSGSKQLFCTVATGSPNVIKVQTRVPLTGTFLKIQFIATLSTLTLTAHYYSHYVSAMEGYLAGTTTYAMAIPAPPGALLQNSGYTQRFIQQIRSQNFVYRARIKMPLSISGNGGRIILVHSTIISAQYQCTLRVYAGSFGKRYQYVYSNSDSCSFSAGLMTYNLKQPESYPANTLVEVIVIPVLTTNNYYSQTAAWGNSDIDIHSNTNTAWSRIPFYLYTGPATISLAGIDIVSREAGQPTSINIRYSTNFNIAPYPATTIEVRLKDFSSVELVGILDQSYPCAGTISPCELWTDRLGQTLVGLKPSVAVPAGTPINLSLDLIRNPTLSNYLHSFATLSLTITIYQFNTNTRHINTYKVLEFLTGLEPVVPAVLASSPVLSNPVQGQATELSLDLVLPSLSAGLLYLQYSGGVAWNGISSFVYKLNGVVVPAIWLNSNFLTVAINLGAQGAQTATLTVSSIFLPYLTNSAAYTLAPSIELRLSGQATLLALSTVALPAYSSLGLPSGSLSVAPSCSDSIKGGSRMIGTDVVVFSACVQLTMTVTSINARKVSQLVGSGFSNLRSCRLQASSYPLDICRVYSDGSFVLFNINLYNFIAPWEVLLQAKIAAPLAISFALRQASVLILQTAHSYSPALSTGLLATAYFRPKSVSRVYSGQSHSSFSFLLTLSSVQIMQSNDQLTIALAVVAAGTYQLSSVYLLLESYPPQRGLAPLVLAAQLVANSYFLTVPLTEIPQATYRVKVIGQTYPSAFTLPSTPFKSSAIVSLTKAVSGVQYQDVLRWSVSNALAAWKVSVGSLSAGKFNPITIRVNFPTAPPASSTISIHFPNHVYSPAAFSSFYSSIGLTLASGAFYGLGSNPSLSSANCRILIPTTAEENTPLRFQITQTGALSALTNYTFTLPLVANPGAGLPIFFDISVESYSATDGSPTLHYHEQLPSFGNAAADTQTSGSFTVSPSSAAVGTSQALSLALGFAMSAGDCLVVRLAEQSAFTSTTAMQSSHSSSLQVSFIPVFNVAVLKKLGNSILSTLPLGTYPLASQATLSKFDLLQYISGQHTTTSNADLLFRTTAVTTTAAVQLSSGNNWQGSQALFALSFLTTSTPATSATITLPSQLTCAAFFECVGSSVQQASAPYQCFCRSGVITLAAAFPATTNVSLTVLLKVVSSFGSLATFAVASIATASASVGTPNAVGAGLDLSVFITRVLPQTPQDYLEFQSQLSADAGDLISFQPAYDLAITFSPLLYFQCEADAPYVLSSQTQIQSGWFTATVPRTFLGERCTLRIQSSAGGSPSVSRLAIGTAAKRFARLNWKLTTSALTLRQLGLVDYFPQAANSSGFSFRALSDKSGATSFFVFTVVLASGALSGDWLSFSLIPNNLALQQFANDLGTAATHTKKITCWEPTGLLTNPNCNLVIGQNRPSIRILLASNLAAGAYLQLVVPDLANTANQKYYSGSVIEVLAKCRSSDLSSLCVQWQANVAFKFSNNPVLSAQCSLTSSSSNAGSSTVHTFNCLRPALLLQFVVVQYSVYHQLPSPLVCSMSCIVLSGSRVLLKVGSASPALSFTIVLGQSLILSPPQLVIDLYETAAHAQARIQYTVAAQNAALTLTAIGGPVSKFKENLISATVSLGWLKGQKSLQVLTSQGLYLRPNYCEAILNGLPAQPLIACQVVNRTYALLTLISEYSSVYAGVPLVLYFKVVIDSFAGNSVGPLTVLGYALATPSSASLMDLGLATLAVSASSAPYLGLATFVKEDFATRLCSTSEQCELRLGIMRYYPWRIDLIAVSVSGVINPFTEQLSACYNLLGQYSELSTCSGNIAGSRFGIFLKPTALYPSFNVFSISSSEMFTTGQKPESLLAVIDYYLNGELVEHATTHTIPVKGHRLLPAMYKVTAPRDIGASNTLLLSLTPSKTLSSPATLRLAFRSAHKNPPGRIDCFEFASAKSLIECRVQVENSQSIVYVQVNSLEEGRELGVALPGFTTPLVQTATLSAFLPTGANFYEPYQFLLAAGSATTPLSNVGSLQVTSGLISQASELLLTITLTTTCDWLQLVFDSPYISEGLSPHCGGGKCYSYENGSTLYFKPAAPLGAGPLSLLIQNVSLWKYAQVGLSQVKVYTLNQGKIVESAIIPANLNSQPSPFPVFLLSYCTSYDPIAQNVTCEWEIELPPGQVRSLVLTLPEGHRVESPPATRLRDTNNETISSVSRLIGIEKLLITQFQSPSKRLKIEVRGIFNPSKPTATGANLVGHYTQNVYLGQIVTNSSSGPIVRGTFTTGCSISVSHSQPFAGATGLLTLSLTCNFTLPDLTTLKFVLAANSPDKGWLQPGSAVLRAPLSYHSAGAEAVISSLPQGSSLSLRLRTAFDSPGLVQVGLAIINKWEVQLTSAKSSLEIKQIGPEDLPLQPSLRHLALSKDYLVADCKLPWDSKIRLIAANDSLEIVPECYQQSSNLLRRRVPCQLLDGELVLRPGSAFRVKYSAEGVFRFNLSVEGRAYLFQPEVFLPSPAWRLITILSLAVAPALTSSLTTVTLSARAPAFQGPGSLILRADPSCVQTDLLGKTLRQVTINGANIRFQLSFGDVVALLDGAAERLDVVLGGVIFKNTNCKPFSLTLVFANSILAVSAGQADQSKVPQLVQLSGLRLQLPSGNTFSQYFPVLIRLSQPALFYSLQTDGKGHLQLLSELLAQYSGPDSEEVRVWAAPTASGIAFSNTLLLAPSIQAVSIVQFEKVHTFNGNEIRVPINLSRPLTVPVLVTFSLLNQSWQAMFPRGQTSLTLLLPGANQSRSFRISCLPASVVCAENYEVQSSSAQVLFTSQLKTLRVEPGVHSAVVKLSADSLAKAELVVSRFGQTVARVQTSTFQDILITGLQSQTDYLLSVTLSATTRAFSPLLLNFTTLRYHYRLDYHDCQLNRFVVSDMLKVSPNDVVENGCQGAVYLSAANTSPLQNSTLLKIEAPSIFTIQQIQTASNQTMIAVSLGLPGAVYGAAFQSDTPPSSNLIYKCLALNGSKLNTCATVQSASLKLNITLKLKPARNFLACFVAGIDCNGEVCLGEPRCIPVRSSAPVAKKIDLGELSKVDPELAKAIQRMRGVRARNP